MGPAEHERDPASILIFGDRSGDRAAAARAAESLGARVIGSEPIGNALDRLDRQIAVDVIMIDLIEDAGPEQARVLDRVDQAVRGGASALISMPLSMLDTHAHREGPSMWLLCEPDIRDRVSTLAFATRSRGESVRENSADAEAERLLRLSEDVARVATALADLSGSVRFISLSAAGESADYASERAIDAGTVRNLIRVRRLREQFFPKDLFGDPAWDMLLDLLAARLEQRRVAVSSLCIAAAVPATTALRWIRMMTEHGWFVRRQDPEDGRRVFIELTDQAVNALIAYFDSARQMGSMLS